MKSHSTYFHPLAQWIILLGLFACSGDSFKVSTRSSAPAVSEDGRGASIAVTGSSADDSRSVNAGVQTAAASRFLYKTAEPGTHTFCLETDSANSYSSSVELTAESVLVLSLVSPGCAAAYLDQGLYVLTVTKASNSSESSLTRIPSSEFFSIKTYPHTQQDLITLVKIGANQFTQQSN